MLPKVIFSAKNITMFNPSAEILRIRKNETFKQGEQFSLTDLHTRIGFLKQSLTKYEGRKQFSFAFKPTHQYEKINEFYHDVEKQGYELKRANINKNMLMQ
jgi:CRISPR-associated protein Cpf1